MRGGKACRTSLAFVSLLAGCGAAKLAVKEPVSSQCASAGLKGCPELTDAILDYVDGDKSAAEPKIRAAVKANSPEQVKKLADALVPISATVGGDAGTAVKAVVRIMLDESGGTSATAKASGAHAGTATTVGDARLPPNLDLDALWTGMSRPSSDPKSSACDSGPLSAGEGTCKKVRALIGPVVVTNMYASGGCPDELFVMAGRPDKPHWFIAAQPNASLNVTGQFIVEDAEELFLGVKAAEGAPKDDVRCTLVWSGFRLAGRVRALE